MVVTELHPDSSWVSKTLSNMTLREKVGQLFCPYMMNEKLNPAEQIEHYASHLREELETLSPCGYYLNRYYAGSTPHIISLLQEKSKIPLFVAADMEAGAGSGLGGIIAPGFTLFPPAMALGATQYPQYAYNVGYNTAQEASILGVNFVFAPVLDVNNNPKNPIINTRSYGEEPYLVATMGAAMIEGLTDGNVIPCAKHFPGHGDVSEDSHLVLTTNHASLERLLEVELLPYKLIMEEMDVASIMTAHISVPALEPDTSLPATFSKRILIDLLREEFGFNGLIITDALLMGAIAKHYDPGTAAVMALEAGADILLMPPDFPTAYHAVLKAVEEERIPLSRIEASVNRILMLKYEFNLHGNAKPTLNKNLLHNQQDAELISYSIACDAITVIDNELSDLPLSESDKIAAIAFFDAVDELSDQGELFFNELENKCIFTESISLTPNDDESVIKQADAIIEDSDIIILAVAINVLPDKGTVEVPDIIERFVEIAEELDKTVILISFGSPYILEQFPDIDNLICAYGYVPSLAAATVDVLFGLRKPNGNLPVRLDLETLDLDLDED